MQKRDCALHIWVYNFRNEQIYFNFKILTATTMITSLIPQQIVAFGERTLKSKSDRLWVTGKTKRSMDLIAGTALLAVTAPVQLLAMAALKTFSGRCLKTEKKTGQGCRVFTQFELDVDALSPRMLGLKLFLMRWGITELPQLVNVIRGEMSLVGPEAAPCNEGERYRYEIPNYGARNFARPGMTGAAQQAGWGGRRDIRKRAANDARYVSKATVKDDLRLLKSAVLPKRA